MSHNVLDIGKVTSLSRFVWDFFPVLSLKVPCPGEFNSPRQTRAVTLSSRGKLVNKTSSLKDLTV